MAKLDFCPVAMEIRAALDERRIADAKRIAAEHLRKGYHSEPFLALVAELIETKKEFGKRGPKRKRLPTHWYEIGVDFERLREGGVSYEDAFVKLEKKWGSRNTIQKAVAVFRKAQQAQFWWQ